MSPELDLKPSHDALQVGLADDEICIREGIVLKICPESRFPFEFFCWRSPPMVKEMDAFIQYAKGCKTLLDVGAHHGLFSLVFQKLGGIPWALEPCDESFDRLSQNFQLNDGLASWFPLALSDKEGKMEMHSEDGHLVANESRIYNVDHPHQIMCEMGDWFCEMQKQAPDIIKIDVEGHEAKVLRGLQQTIVKHRPIIFLEAHTERLKKQGESRVDIADLLPGYSIHDLTDDNDVDRRLMCLP